MARRIDAGVLAARIVVGDDDAVGEPRGDLAHHRPLAGIAVAAAAEHHDEPAAAMRAERREHGLERVGRVRVIDDDGRAVGARRHMLHAAGRAFEPLRAPPAAASAGTPVAIARPSAASAFIAWNAPISGRTSWCARAHRGDRDALARALGRALR